MKEKTQAIYESETGSGTSGVYTIDRFLAYIASRVTDRGLMADLRQGFNPGTGYRAWPHIAAWCDLTNDRERTIWLTVAAGFAVHGGSVQGRNMGLVLRAIATGNERGPEGLKSFDARFRRLLSCATAQELCHLLPGILRAAARRNVSVDYGQLYRDIRYWPSSKLRWAREFWGSPSEKATQ